MQYSPLLATHALTVQFGGVTAVDDVSLTAEAGALTGLIGPNGAGKTTFIDAVSGLVRASGDITFAGQAMAGWQPHRRARAGLGRSFQSLELFNEFSVQENLLIPADSGGRWSFVSDLARPRTGRDAMARVTKALEMVGLEQRSDAYPHELSLGERKLVAIARALAGGARLVLLDEPAAGLNSADSLRLGGRLQHLVRSGVTVLLVDHDMGLVLGVCDLIHVLEFGKLIASGSADEIRTNQRVVEAYLGHEGPEVLSEAESR